MSVKLKPCPFCGGTNIHIMDGGYPHWVYCRDCGARAHGGVAGKTLWKMASVEAWNRRAPEKTEYIPENKAIPTARSCVDLAEKVTATFYDEEHEKWTQRTVTIADILDSVCDAYTILPSAEPEIIRCKDCKWYGRADKRRFYRGMDCLQHRIDTIVPDKDFCSRAERRRR